MPLAYLVEAFEERKEISAGSPRKAERALRSRRSQDSRTVRVALDNGEAYTVPWDTVLMACEPQFEYFGGLTLESRAMTQRWLRKVGSFRRD